MHFGFLSFSLLTFTQTDGKRKMFSGTHIVENIYQSKATCAHAFEIIWKCYFSEIVRVMLTNILVWIYMLYVYMMYMLEWVCDCWLCVCMLEGVYLSLKLEQKQGGERKYHFSSQLQVKYWAEFKVLVSVYELLHENIFGMFNGYRPSRTLRSCSSAQIWN